MTAQPPQEEAAPKQTTVLDYETEDVLAEALRAAKLADWQYPVWDKNTTEGDINDVKAEARRLMTLKSYNILDSASECHFDELTKEAQDYFKIPVAVVTLVDIGRQWFKSVQGFPATETPRCVSFCQHVVKRKERLGPMVIEDATKDERFKNNPLVSGPPNVTFYAGAPLRTPEGETLGSFCIMDFKPRKLTTAEIRRLEDFAQEAVFLIITRQPSAPAHRRASA
jgi:GAF domain-containing protein